VVTANPCPCGQGTGNGLTCGCRPQEKRRYLGRLSGPLLDPSDQWVIHQRRPRILVEPDDEPTLVDQALPGRPYALQDHPLAARYDGDPATGQNLMCGDRGVM
jgi:hypothetical protein